VFRDQAFEAHQAGVPEQVRTDPALLEWRDKDALGPTREAGRHTRNLSGAIEFVWLPPESVMPMIRKRIRLASRSPLRGQTLCAKRRAPWSRFRGVRTAHSRTSGLSFIDMYQQDLPSSKPQRLLEYRLALVRNLARNLALCSGLHLGCGNGHHLLALASELARGIGIDVSPGMSAIARARLRNSAWKANRLRWAPRS
jgi:hypothetical protein